MVCITGQVPLAAIGTDAFQECDTIGITRSVTKHNYLVTEAAGHPADRPRGVPHRHHRPARPGAASTSPRTSSTRRTPARRWTGTGPPTTRSPPACPATSPTTKGHPQMIRAGGRADPASPPAGHLRRRRHPQGPGGRGAARAGRADATSTSSPRSWPGAPSPTTTRSASACRACTATTPRSPSMQQSRPAHRPRQPLRRPGHRQGRRLRPRRQDHPRRHRPGRAGQGPPARRRRSSATAAWSSRSWSWPSATCSTAAPSSPDRAGLEADDLAAGRRSTRSPTSSPSRATRSSRSSCSSTLRDSTPDDTIVASGVGQHQMWTSQYWKFNHPYTWVNSGGLGTMGFSVPGRHRRQGRPARPHGVGRRRRRLLPDDRPGAGHRGQPSASRSRSPSSTTPTSAWSASGRRCSTTSATPRCTCRPTCPTTRSGPRPWAASACGSSRPRRSTPAIEKANEIDDRPVVIDFRTDAREKVYPMVPPASPTTRSSSTRPRAKGAAERCRASRRRRPPPHPRRCWSRTRPACSPASPSLFARRGFNIFSLAVAPTDDERFSRITIVVDVESAPLEQIIKQLVQADQRGEDQRARPPRLGRARAACSPPSRADADARGQVIELVEPVRGPDRRRRPRRADRQPRRRARPARRLRGAAAALRHRRAAAHRPGGPAQARALAPDLRSVRRTRLPTAAVDLTAMRRHVDRTASRGTRDGQRLLREGRRPVAHRRPQGGGDRLRLAGPRPRPEPEGLGRRRARRPARGLVVGGQGRGRRAAGARRSPRPPPRPT